jgi:hypothetical protein
MEKNSRFETSYFSFGLSALGFQLWAFSGKPKLGKLRIGNRLARGKANWKKTSHETTYQSAKPPL